MDGMPEMEVDRDELIGLVLQLRFGTAAGVRAHH